MNLIRAAPNEVVYGPSAAAIATMRATSRTLTDDPAIRAVAACLGDPLVARITNEGVTRDHRPAAYILGTGVRGRPGARGSEVLCRSARTRAEAARLAAAIRHTLAHGKVPGRKPIPMVNAPHAHYFAGARYTAILRGIKVTARNDGAPTVRVTARPVRWAGPATMDALWSFDMLTPLDG